MQEEQLMMQEEMDDHFFFNRGSALDDLGKKEDAIKDYTRAIEINPKNDNAYYNRGSNLQLLVLGSALDDLGKKEDAIKDYTRVIEIYPNYDYAYFNRGSNLQLLVLGNTLNDLGKKDEAIKDDTRAIEINPNYDYAYFNRGELLVLGNTLNDLGKKDEAIKDYTRAIEINPTFFPAYYNRGVVLNSLGMKVDAINDYTRAIEINPNYVQAYFNRGIALGDLGKKEDAIKDFTRAIEINPEYHQAYYNRGVYLSDLGKKEDSIKDYSRAIEINPEYHQAYFNRGVALFYLGKQAEALLDCLKALELVPNNPLYSAQNIKAKTYFHLAEQQLKLLTEQKIKEFNLSQGNIRYIQEKITLIQEIEIEIAKTEKLFRSNSLSQQQQHELEINLQETKKQFDQEIIKPTTKNSDVTQLQLILITLQKQQEQIAKLEEQNAIKDKKIAKLEEQDIKQQHLLSQESVVIKKELELLKTNKNKYRYYTSLYWRVYPYLLACMQISTDLFTTNNDAVIETTSEQVAQVVSKVGVAIADNIPIPLISTAFNLIDSALEFYKKRKLQVRVQSLANLIKKKISALSELEIEIQFGVIQLANLLPDNLQIKEKSKNIYTIVESILNVDYNGGIEEAKDPYWIQGIQDSISILHYFEGYNCTIQGNSQENLRDMIVKGAQTRIQITHKAEEGACSKFCSVQ